MRHLRLHGPDYPDRRFDLKADLTLAVNALASTNGLRVTASDGLPHKLAFVAVNGTGSPFTRIVAMFVLVLGIGLIGGAVGSFAASGDIAALFVALMLALLVRFAVSGLVRPRLEARSTGVYVRNIVWEFWVPRSGITSVGGDMNVTITTASGTILTVWAVQKTNIASMLNHRSRVDRVAERLSETLASQRAPAVAATDEGMRQRYLWLPIWMTVAFWLYVVVLIITLRQR